MARFSTSIMQVTAKGAQTFGKYIIVGSIPSTCYDATRNNGAGGSMVFETEADALKAILADPWIQSTPTQLIQRADCSVYHRPQPITDEQRQLADFQMQASGRLFV